MHPTAQRCLPISMTVGPPASVDTHISCPHFEVSRGHFIACVILFSSRLIPQLYASLHRQNEDKVSKNVLIFLSLRRARGTDSRSTQSLLNRAHFKEGRIHRSAAYCVTGGTARDHGSVRLQARNSRANARSRAGASARSELINQCRA